MSAQSAAMPPAPIDDRREQVGWYFYDWANSAFSTTVVTVFLGPYLTSVARAAADANGLVYPLDYRDEGSVSLLLGIALTAAGAGGEVTVQRSGALTDSSWTWSYGPLWLGAAGAITQTPPDDGFDVAIGVATAATRILLDIQPPIALE